MPKTSATPTRATTTCDGERRRAQLQRLLPLWPNEIADSSIESRRRIVRLLARTLRDERRRGVSGHWAYDLSRHAALARLYRQECAMLRAAEIPGWRTPGSKR